MKIKDILSNQLNVANLLSDTYKKPIIKVMLDIIETEDNIRGREIYKNNDCYSNNYFYLAGGQLSEVYKNENKQ